MKELIKSKLSKELGDFDINDFYEYAADLYRLCNNWPVVPEPCDLIDCDKEQQEPEVYEFVDTENFEAEFKLNSEGKEYMEVSCGGDWQDCHDFDIIINEGEDKDKYPLTCVNIKYSGEDFDNRDYVQPSNYAEIRKGLTSHDFETLGAVGTLSDLLDEATVGGFDENGNVNIGKISVLSPGGNSRVIDSGTAIGLDDSLSSNGNIFEKPRGRHKWIK